MGGLVTIGTCEFTSVDRLLPRAGSSVCVYVCVWGRVGACDSTTYAMPSFVLP